MYLNECPPGFFKVVRNGSFQALGTLKHRQLHQLSFLSSIEYLQTFNQQKNITCIITTRELACHVQDDCGCAIALDPRYSFIKLHMYLATGNFFYQRGENITKIDPSATVHPTAIISNKNITIGKNCQIGAHVIINPNTTVDEEVFLGPGVIIGCDGYYPQRYPNEIVLVPSTGGVRIFSNVVVQSYSTICRGVFGGYTLIGRETKIGNHVDINHDVIIGAGTFIGSGAIVSGNVYIGNDTWIGPHSTLSNNITIDDRANITLGSVVTQDVPLGKKISGNFAIDHGRFIDNLRKIR
jgi:UDP-3-O-[3-hydroxymyristoyl] glucosamine N-acyltransferase